MNRVKWYILIIGALALLSGCANRGQGPQGGPKDSIPPTLLKETPLNGTCNFKGKSSLRSREASVG